MRWYGVATGSYDDYHETFIQAECPYEAAVKYLKSEYVSYNEVATVHDAVLNKYNILHVATELCKVELVGPRGYLWDRDLSDPLDLRRCKLCGDTADENDPMYVNDDCKCRECEKLKQVRVR